MINHQVHADLARERHRQSLAEADAARRASRYEPEGVELRDGSRVVIRPVRSIDAGLLLDGFRRLSPRSRRLRFIGAKNALSAAEVRYFTDVDHHDHEALGAVSAPHGHGVGVARFVRVVDDPHAAEIAVTVVDEWQGRGLGGVLLDRLAQRAQEEGLDRLVAHTSVDNTAMTALLQRMGGRPDRVGRLRTTVTYEITLQPEP
jgi:RimJ/RimL family protein N-acetyltransferase